MEDLLPLLVGLLIFFGTHLVSAVPSLRASIVGAIGEDAYKGLFTALSLGGLLIMIWGTTVCPFIVVWHAPDWADLFALAFMPLAMILIVAAYISNDIRKLVRHPMLWGIVLWAFTHLIANGDLGGIMLFGSFLIYGLSAQLLMDRKMARTDPEAWNEVERQTSFWPFAGIMAKKPFDGQGDPAWRPIVIGLFAFAVIFATHAYIFGVAAAWSIGL